MERLKWRPVSLDFGYPTGREDFHQIPRYRITTILGQGGFGFVVEAEGLEDINEEGAYTRVAIKKLPAVFRHEKLTLSALREICTLRHFLQCCPPTGGRVNGHDNILGLRDLYAPLPIKDDGSCTLSYSQLPDLDFYIVLDLMDMDLAELLKTVGTIDAEQRKFLVYQLLRGLKAVHSAKVLHRDLKPQNLLVNANCDLKIADFGLARTYDETGMTVQGVQTMWYRAPEVLLGEVGEQETGVYSMAVDIWSVGCIMAELMLRRPIFPGRAHNLLQLQCIFNVVGYPTPTPEMSQNIRDFLNDPPPSIERKEPMPWTDIFPEAVYEAEEVDLVSRMLTFDPAQRISVNEALTHPFLSQFHDPDDEPETDCDFGLPNMVHPSIGLLKQFAAFHPEAQAIVDALEQQFIEVRAAEEAAAAAASSPAAVEGAESAAAARPAE